MLVCRSIPRAGTQCRPRAGDAARIRRLGYAQHLCPRRIDVVRTMVVANRFAAPVDLALFDMDEVDRRVGCRPSAVGRRRLPRRRRRRKQHQQNERKPDGAHRRPTADSADFARRRTEFADRRNDAFWRVCELAHITSVVRSDRIGLKQKSRRHADFRLFTRPKSRSGSMDPFKELTHGGILDVAEIQFHTSFDYMFPLLAAKSRVPATSWSHHARCASRAWNCNGYRRSSPMDSPIPAIFTYLGQFIDHDITAANRPRNRR